MCQDSRIKAGVVVSCAGHSIACSFIPARRPPPISHRPGYLDLIILPFASSSTKTTSCLQTSTPPLPLRQTFQRIMLPSRLRRLHHPPQSIPKQDLLILEVSRPLHRPSLLQSPPPTTLLSALVSFSASCKPYDQDRVSVGPAMHFPFCRNRVVSRSEPSYASNTTALTIRKILQTYLSPTSSSNYSRTDTLTHFQSRSCHGVHSTKRKCPTLSTGEWSHKRELCGAPKTQARPQACYR